MSGDPTPRLNAHSDEDEPTPDECTNTIGSSIHRHTRACYGIPNPADADLRI